MRKRVLITGMEGFTGIHLSKLLTSQGHEVFGTSYQPVRIPRTVQLDLRQKNATREVIKSIRPDYVVNLAGISNVDDNANEFYHTNVIGTQNLLDSLLEADLKLKKVILVSSALVYGNGQGCLSERSQLCPVNHYGISKLAMENLSTTYFDKLPIIITRPFNYTGIGQSSKFVIPKIINHFKERAEKLELGNIHVKREYNNVYDVARIYSELLDTSHSSVTVNIGSGHTYSIQAIIKELEELTNHKINVVINPLFVRPNEVLELKSDTTYLNKLLDSKPFTTPIKETLIRMLRE